MHPWHAPDDLLADVVDRLLGHDRPFTAMSVLVDHDAEKHEFPAALALRTLQVPRTGTAQTLEQVHSPQYVIGELVTRLAAAGVDDDAFTDVECYYLPLLHDQYVPHALHRRLARDPAFFADAVGLIYRRTDDDTATTGDDKASAEQPPADEADLALDGAPPPEGSVEPEAEIPSHVVDAAWTLLHDWHTPLPGAVDGTPPTAEQTQAWVTAARVALRSRGREQIASVVISEALSGPATDEDGTWPSEAVRAVLEHEHDKELENGLHIGRCDQRGVTVRHPYAGGTQERESAEQYRSWADARRRLEPSLPVARYAPGCR